jgi:L-fuculose-phosphate aldolase
MRMQLQREQIVFFGRQMLETGLTAGTGGNLSVFKRAENQVAVSPSGISYTQMRLEDVVVVDMAGNLVEGCQRPTSEVNVHLALYQKRPDIRAVVHTHSPFATTLACLQWELPAVHYLVGFSGVKVPLAPYATFGTPELARCVANAIGDHMAVLLANHGLVTVGADLPRAFAVAEQIEFAARIYWQARAVGSPRVLSEEEMHRVMVKFKDYGPRKAT